MKTTLALIALFSIALSAGAAVIETIGITVSPLVSMETGLGLFVGAFALLLFGATYSEPRTAEGSHRASPRLLPAVEAFAPRPVLRSAALAQRSCRSVEAVC